MFAECAGKIVIVLKADPGADFLYRQVGVQQQFTRFGQAQFRKVMNRRPVVDILEIAQECPLGQIRASGQVIQSYLFGIL